MSQPGSSVFHMHAAVHLPALWAAMRLAERPRSTRGLTTALAGNKRGMHLFKEPEVDGEEPK
jgi:hypothetical protein